MRKVFTECWVVQLFSRPALRAARGSTPSIPNSESFQTQDLQANALLLGHVGKFSVARHSWDTPSGASPPQVKDGATGFSRR